MKNQQPESSVGQDSIEPANVDRRSLLQAALIAGLGMSPLSKALTSALAALDGADAMFGDGFETPPPSAGSMSFTVFSPNAQAQAPLALGYAFRRGDVPAGSSLVSNLGGLQVTPRNYWSDGSLKFAQLVWRGAVGPTPVTVGLAAGTAAGGAALTLADLQNTGVTASINAGTYGTVSWSSSDWATPFTFAPGQSAWVSGPLMSSWLYRKPVGSDPHLVAWLEVRLYAGGAVEVLPWIENGYLNVAAPNSKAATFVFTLGGTQRFSAAITLPHHCRTPLVSGNALSYWHGGTDPQITLQHDAAYLMASELVPTYRATVATTAAAVTALPASYTPLQQGSFNYDGDGMTSSGYQEPIGMLPQHDVLYLTAPNGAAHAAVVRNGYSAGRYPIHYRDETTHRPFRFSAYPGLGISDGSQFHDNGASTSYTPTVSGAVPPKWDCAHSPSVGFVAYLVTGRWYFMEQLQFAATANHLGKGSVPALRDGAKGLVKPEIGAWQTRAAAWQWRTLAQAVALTPEIDTNLRAEFISATQFNIDNLYGQYVARPNNPFGFIQTGAMYGNSAGIASPWQQDFFTAATGYLLAMEPAVSSQHLATLASFFQWIARSIVGRLGDASGHWYINGDPYVTRISNAAVPDFATGTGPWLASWAEVYAALPAALTASSSPNTWIGATEGVLNGEIMPGERAMWGNLQPAISYAVRFGVTGALAAYNRMIGATNWNNFTNACNVAPVWSVRPARGEAVVPAWLAGAPLNTWVEIPNSALSVGPVPSFGGFAARPLDSTLLIAAAGGHSDSSNNAVASINLSQDAPTWILRQTATANPTQNPVSTWGYDTDGKPAAMHLYHSLQYVPTIDAVLRLNPRYTWPSAFDLDQVPRGFNDAFSMKTPPNTTNASGWAGRGVHPVSPAGASDYALCVDADGRVWTSTLRRYDPATKTWLNPVTSSGASLRFPGAYDSKRRQVFTMQWGDSQGSNSGWSISRIPIDGNAQINVTINPSAAFTTLTSYIPQYMGLAYDELRDEFMIISGGSWTGPSGTLVPNTNVFIVKPNATNAWDITQRAMSGVSWTCHGDGVNSRLKYLPQLKGFVFMPAWNGNLVFCRTA